ncbi:ABC transporter ATP-binding protein [Shewanella sp. NIFS-20-20]|uniref:ABC transporter ATP-binding protein n=1 Tax=Shewanella sp. NIFS-20-20 TaxID=2853806 RepID=UPI001C470D77|nr:ABC transporter ATP-binding protein [Shewanella sp. NIFS-20-20]MBV7314372.1 ABC transporter ATP-binding protein [Shewanella sp. NIFS-20-20]
MTLVTISGLCKRYQQPVLQQLSLTIVKGEPVALVGANGAGKTTLFGCIAGFFPFDAGEINVLGQAPGSPKLVNRIGVLPQDAKLNPNETIRNQLMFMAQLQGFNKRQARDETDRVLALVGMQTSANSKPGQLSHGMAKRVAIAQALIGTPELVLLDEPTAGLDPLNARELRQLIQSLSDKVTFVISSHNLDELESLCRQVIYLEHGQVTRQLDLNAHQHSCLSLELCHDSADAEQTLRALAGVTQVSNTKNRLFIIEYDSNQAFALEQSIFELLASRGWQYKLLMKGKTLEESLFG